MLDIDIITNTIILTGICYRKKKKDRKNELAKLEKKNGHVFSKTIRTKVLNGCNHRNKSVRKKK